MRLLLDTHVVIAIVDLQLAKRYPSFDHAINDANNLVFVSVASLWEIAVKTRIGKLDIRLRPPLIAYYLKDIGITVLDIKPEHVVAGIQPDVPTRDPFERLLIAIAQIERMSLLTADRALADHPVTFR